MENTLEFYVQGSAYEPYTVQITLSPLTATCTCQAGLWMTVCKHRSQILLGKNPGIVGGDIALLPSIAKIASDYGFPNALKTYEKAKSELAAAEKKSEQVFKKLRDTQYRFSLGELKTNRVVKSAFDDLTEALNEAVEAKLKSVRDEEKLKEILKTNG